MGSNVYSQRDHERYVEIQDDLRSRAAELHCKNHARRDLPARPAQPPRSRLRDVMWAGGVAVAVSLSLFPWIAAIAPGALAAYAEPAPTPRSQVAAPAAIATQAEQPPAEHLPPAPTRTPMTPTPLPTPVQAAPTPTPVPLPSTPSPAVPVPTTTPVVTPAAEPAESSKPKPKNCYLLCPPAN